MSVTAYIALGSNLGDRRDFLDRALALLCERTGVYVTRVSAYLETDPVGGPPDQGQHSMASEAETELALRRSMQVLLDVERRLGRIRQERFGPRTICSRTSCCTLTRFPGGSPL